ncbi:uncharacterized protein [Spinacia oleracea]|uniref:DUF4283 domain-containing protein n=1 Tax=Spinacia oleracea TaxID=3562 RepID=A0ABM3RIP6_SPIOL|nr:uncharacterized protein LOC110793511 [Spinacia oleracea]
MDTQDMDFSKEDLRSVPIWVKLHNLDFKYWGEKSLSKIVGKLGILIHVDSATAKRDKLLFERVQCKGMGHEVSKCRKVTGRRVWVPKVFAAPLVTSSTDHVKAEQMRIMGRMVKWWVCYRILLLGEGTSLAAMDSIVSWNMRGINTQRKKNEVPPSKLGALYINMFSGWCFTTNSRVCKGGRVMIAWNPSTFTLTLLGISSQMIHCLVFPRNRKSEFFYTIVYAFNQSAERETLWRDLCVFGGNMCKPWDVMGDFKWVLNVDERVCAPVRHQSMIDFRNCVNCCGLEDVKSVGHFYTRNNKQEGIARVFSKIDRVMANDLWMQTFPSAEAGFLSEGLFDHCP